MTKLQALNQKRIEAVLLRKQNEIRSKAMILQSSGNVKTSWSKACNINTLIDCGHLNYNMDKKVPKK